MRRSSWTAIVALVAAAVPVGAGLASATTGSPVAGSTPLPLTHVTDAVVDVNHHRAFVSSYPEGRVAVVDLATGDATRLPYLPGASDLAVDETGDFVWVSLRTEGAVARIPTTAPYDVERFDLDLDCPRDLVAAAGVVYVGVGSCSGNYLDLVVLDPASGQVTPSAAETSPFLYGPVLRPIPGTTRFHFQETGTSGPDAGIIDAATDELVARRDGTSVLAVTTDGQNLLDASGAVLSATDLTTTGQWTVPRVEGAQLQHAVLSTGGLMAFPATEGLVVHDLAGGSTLQTWQADPAAYPTVHRAFWDGGRLYGLAGERPASLIDVPDPTAAITSVLEVNDPAREDPVTFGGEYTVRGRLTDGQGFPLAGAPIEVLSPTGRAGSTTTAPDGTWAVDVVVDTYLLRAYFAGDATHQAVVATVRPFIATQEFLTVAGPSTAAPGDVLVFQGAVVDQDDRPLPGRDVNVWWSCGGRGFEGTVVTGSDGTFRYETEAPRCPELTVDFFVDGPHGSFHDTGAAATTTTIGWRVASLEATGPERLVPGETGTWHARLTVDGAPLADAALQFSAWENGALKAGSLTTGADGTVTLTTDAFDEGTTQIRFRYPGDAETLGATGTVATRVERWTSTLTVTPPTTTPVAGQPLALDGTLVLGDGSSAAGRIVTLSRGGETVATAIVGGDGSYSLVHRPDAGGESFVVRFAGDSRHKAAEVIFFSHVQPATTVVTSAVPAFVSPERRARVVATAEPGYAGMCLTHRLDRRTSDGWRTVRTTGCRATDDHGRSSFRTPALRPGTTYRVRASFAGDDRTAPDRGTWKRFRAH